MGKERFVCSGGGDIEKYVSMDDRYREKGLEGRMDWSLPDRDSSQKLAWRTEWREIG